MKLHMQWKQLSVVKGNSSSVAAKLLCLSAVMHHLHMGTSSIVEVDGEFSTDIQSPQSISTNHIRVLYFLLLQCLLQVSHQSSILHGTKHFLAGNISVCITVFGV